MGTAFGCTAGDRVDNARSPRDTNNKVTKPAATNGGAKQPLLTDDMAILLEEEQIEAEAEAEEVGASVIVFQGHIGLSMRTSFVTTLLALPVVIPAWNTYFNSIPGLPAWMAMIPGGVCLMVVFTVYQNLGNTLQLAWQGAAGTFIGCCWSHVMSATMPYGASGEHYDPYIMNAANIGLIVFTYWLNLSKNVRMFIVSYHVFFVMALQNPNADPLMNTTWAINWTAQTTTTMCTALIGMVGAVLVVAFPTPLTAKSHARRSAGSIAQKTCDMVDHLFVYYQRSEPSVTITQLEVEALQLAGKVQAMRGDIEAAWWEHLDIGRGGKVRSLLTRHVGMLSTLSDNIFAMQICISREDFGNTHVQCMAKIKGRVSALLITSRELLVKATEAAGDGDIDKSEEAALRALMDQVTDCISQLAKNFNQTRKVMFPTKVINVDLQAESFFVYCLSIHARLIVEYTQKMLDEPPKTTSVLTHMVVAFKGVFNFTMMKASLNKSSFAFRGSLEILIMYYMGMYLFEYNAAGACCISLLLSDFAGSAMVKNLGRLQAVVLAAIVPHVIARLQGTSCDPAIASLKAFSIFAFEVLTCYIYYSSATYGYIGCLTAAFALSTLIYPCTLESSAEAAASELTYSFAQYTKILQTTIACIVMMTVDSILSGGRASDLGTNSLLKALMSVDAWFQAVFMTRLPEGDVKGAMEKREDFMKDAAFAKEIQRTFNGPRQTGTISGHLNMADMLGAEADKEPRYHRAAWPTAFFNRCVRIGHILRANLNMVEQVLQGSRSESLYTDIFGKIRETREWKAVQDDVVNTLGDAIFMVQEVLHNETAKPLPDVAEKAATMENSDKLEAMDALFVTINKSGLKYPPDQGLDSLEEDVICRINVILMLMDASVGNVADMTKECLKMAG